MEQLDQAVTLWLNGLNCAFTDPIWVFITRRQSWYALYLIIAGCMIWRLGWKRGLLMILVTALSIACVDQAANLVKDAVARLRPCNDPSMIDRGLHLLQKANKNQYGFFSAHAGNAMAFAVCTIAAFRMDRHATKNNWQRIYAAVIMVWAVLVGLSRVFVGKHFLGDVLVGYAVGALVALALVWLAKRLLGARAAKSAGTAA